MSAAPAPEARALSLPSTWRQFNALTKPRQMCIRDRIISVR